MTKWEVCISVRKSEFYTIEAETPEQAEVLFYEDNFNQRPRHIITWEEKVVSVIELKEDKDSD